MLACFALIAVELSGRESALAEGIILFLRWKPFTPAVLQEEGAVERLTERMKAVLGPFVLRRLKSEVASQLTAKQHHEELVNMTPEQEALYQKAVSHLRAEVTANTKGNEVAVVYGDSLRHCHACPQQNGQPDAWARGAVPKGSVTTQSRKHCQDQR